MNKTKVLEELLTEKISEFSRRWIEESDADEEDIYKIGIPVLSSKSDYLRSSQLILKCGVDLFWGYNFSFGLNESEEKFKEEENVKD